MSDWFLGVGGSFEKFCLKVSYVTGISGSSIILLELRVCTTPAGCEAIEELGTSFTGGGSLLCLAEGAIL